MLCQRDSFWQAFQMSFEKKQSTLCFCFWILFTECDTGFYGHKCQDPCNSNCKISRVCHHITGECTDGCKDGWHGKQCLEKGSIIYAIGFEMPF